MRELPPYIKAVYEGGRKIELLSEKERTALDVEIKQLQTDIDSLDPGLRADLEYVLKDPLEDEFIFKEENE